MKRFMAGFAILFKYKPDGDMAAEHDEVFCDGPSPDAMTEEERATLEANGWRHSDDEGWRKFV